MTAFGDRSAFGSLASAWFLPITASRKTTALSLEDQPLFFLGIDWAAAEHAVSWVWPTRHALG